jgi:hypothetical protein
MVRRTRWQQATAAVTTRGAGGRAGRQRGPRRSRPCRLLYLVVPTCWSKWGQAVVLMSMFYLREPRACELGVEC